VHHQPHRRIASRFLQELNSFDPSMIDPGSQVPFLQVIEDSGKVGSPHIYDAAAQASPAHLSRAEHRASGANQVVTASAIQHSIRMVVS
jgi:hypothetical protein